MKKLETRLRTPALMALVAGVLVLGGCNNGSFGGRDDKAIIQDIQAKLYQDPTLKSRDIHVDAQKGVVVLTGSVASDQERASAEQIAKTASGVKQVMDEIQLAPALADVPVAPANADMAQAEPPAAAAERPVKARQRSSRQRRPSAREAEQQTPPPDSSYHAGSQPPQQSDQTTPSSAPPPAPAAVAQAQPPAPPPPPPPLQLTIPAGSVVSIRMTDTVDSAVNHPGDEFGATISAPIVVEGHVAIPRGANARIKLVESSAAGHMKGQSMLELALVSITANGATYDVTSSAYTARGQSRGKRTAETVGGGAALGAIIGAIAGHGKGAAIGSVIGAGAGAGAQAATKPEQVKVPSETKIDFVLKSPLDVTLQAGDAAASE